MVEAGHGRATARRTRAPDLGKPRKLNAGVFWAHPAIAHGNGSGGGPQRSETEAVGSAHRPGSPAVEAPQEGHCGHQPPPLPRSLPARGRAALHWNARFHLT